MPVSLTWKRMGSAWTQPKTPRGNLIASSPKRQATSPKRKRTSKKTHPITTNHWRDRWSDNQHPGPRRSFTVVLIPTKIWFYQVNVLQNRDKHRQNIKQLISLPETNSFASENRPSIKLCIPTIHFQVSGRVYESWVNQRLRVLTFSNKVLPKSAVFVRPTCAVSFKVLARWPSSMAWSVTFVSDFADEKLLVNSEELLVKPSKMANNGMSERFDWSKFFVGIFAFASEDRDTTYSPNGGLVVIYHGTK